MIEWLGNAEQPHWGKESSRAIASILRWRVMTMNEENATASPAAFRRWLRPARDREETSHQSPHGGSTPRCGRVRSRHPARTSVAGSVLCLLLGFCHVLCRPQAYRATSDSLLKFSLATRRHPPDITSDARERRDCDRGVHVYESEAVCR
jgi:hypothetical protein